MNRLLDDRYDELIHRLVWGLELYDAVSGFPAGGAGIEVEGATSSTVRLVDHGNGRHSLTFRRGLPVSLRWLVTGPAVRFVARRLMVDLATEVELDTAPLAADPALRLARTGRRISLFPGAGYPAVPGATVLRGVVVRNDRPLRWARVEVRVGSIGPEVVARAQSDAAGEFFAVIGPLPAFDVASVVDVDVSVAAPGAVPDRLILDPSGVDPFWDLPAEELPRSGSGEPLPTDDVGAGVRLPVGYRLSAGGPSTHPIRIGSVTVVPAVAFT